MFPDGRKIEFSLLFFFSLLVNFLPSKKRESRIKKKKKETGNKLSIHSIRAPITLQQERSQSIIMWIRESVNGEV